MVAPTWNKSVNKKLKKAWNAAYAALVNANEIRIIGYSLPVADAYVKYLLKAAVTKSDHLRRIDILFKPSSTVKSEVQRYREFITFRNARMSYSDAASYIKDIKRGNYTVEMVFSSLESSHEQAFSTAPNLHEESY